MTALVVVACLSARAAAPDAPSPPSTIAEVRVEGNRRLSREAVLAHVRARAGEAYRARLLRDDHMRLLRTGQFSRVQVIREQTGKGLVVTFVVAERPLVEEVAIRGAKAFEVKELLEELPFGRRDPLDRFSVEAGRRALLVRYREAGHYFARVEVDAGALRRRRVIYSIVEGPNVQVEDVRVEGNTFFTPLFLWWHTSTRARIWWLPFLSFPLDTEKIATDVNRLRKLYIDEGFLDAEVGRILEFSDDKQRVRVTFVVREGPRYRLNRLVFRGNAIFSSDELASRMLMERGDFLKADAMTTDRKRLKRAYGEIGYIEAKISGRKQFLSPDRPVPEWAGNLGDRRVALANLVFDVREGGQYRVGRVEIRTRSPYKHGDATAQTRLARREVRLFPGRLFNMKAAERSEQRLKNTGVFESAKITPVGGGPGVRDALVEVGEAQTANFMVGVGLSTNTGASAMISLTERNFDWTAWPRGWTDVVRRRAFRGAGETFRVSAQPGAEMSTFQVRWGAPYLSDRPYSLGLSVFLYTRDWDTYEEDRTGGTVSLGHRFANGWYAEVASRYEEIGIGDLSDDAPAQVESVEGEHQMLGVKLSLIRDRTDNRWLPSEGDRLSLSGEQTLGDFSFHTLTGDYRVYRTLHVDVLDRKHILGLKCTVGRIFGSAPVFERFYGGGIGSVRGFRYRGISPRTRPDNEPIGGHFLLLAGTEYGYPIVGEFFRGVLFFDTGTVEDDVEITTYRAATGFGFRWIVPAFSAVPIRLDFGFPLIEDDKDRTKLVSFSLGMSW